MSEGKKAHVALIRRITIVSVLVNLLLSLIKIVGGIVGHSYSLIIDGIHSLSDLFSDAVVYYAAIASRADADDDHPYGHGKIEPIAILLLAFSLIALAALLLYNAVDSLISLHTVETPNLIAYLIIIASIVLKEGLYHYTIRHGRRINSNLLIANAWHHRTDSISSVIVLIGIAGTSLGLIYLDLVAAIIISAMIAKIGLDLVKQALDDLADRGLDPEKVGQIDEAVRSTPGVKSTHLLRTRRLGSDAFVDLHLILADPYISVSEGHLIGERVRLRLIERFDEVSDVTIHVDPEDDYTIKPIANYHDRDRLRQLCGEERWDALLAQYEISSWRLHYLDNRIRIELITRNPDLINDQTLEALRQFEEETGGNFNCAGIDILYSRSTRPAATGS